MKPRLVLAALLVTLTLAGCSVSREDNTTAITPAPEPEILTGQSNLAPAKVRLKEERMTAPAVASESMAVMSLEAHKRADGMVMPSTLPSAPLDREQYAHYDDNPLKLARETPLSTFSIDVDTGAYANLRRILNEGRLPPKDAVRVSASPT